jgi:hypothetical protein
MWRSGVDYHALIAKAVRSLDQSTDKARRALYERARAALMKELRTIHPALSESAIAKERLTLEGAIRKVVTDILSQARPKSRETRPHPPPPSVAPLEQDAEAIAAEETAASRVQPTKPLSKWLAAEWTRGFTAVTQIKAAKKRGDENKPPPELQICLPTAGDHRHSLSDTVYDRGHLSAANEFERVQKAREPFNGGEGQHHCPALSRRKMVASLVTLLILVGFAGVISWQWPRVSGLYGHVAQIGAKQPFKQSEPPSASASKLSDRFHQEANAQPASATREGQPLAAEAQRVVLYEEDSSESQGKRYFGLVTWRTENRPTGPVSATDIAVRADIKIPERLTTMTWLLRRNVDHALAASHTVEMVFDLPADFAGRGIATVPGILMKQSEEMPGKPLAKLAVQSINGVVTIELSAADEQRQRSAA